MNNKEFENYIISLGFCNKNAKNLFYYKEFKIYLTFHDYRLYNGYIWSSYFTHNDIDIIKFEMLKEIRSIKLKNILNK